MRRIVLVVALSSIAQVVAAQAPATGRIEGSVTDSVHAAPLAGATVSLARLDAQRDSTLVATTTEEGRFRFEHLMAGRYALSFSNAFLDSLEFGGVPTALAVRGGEVARVELAVPSGATLRAIACPGMALSRGTGALVGVVTDADTDRPLGGAQVAAMWTELTFDARMRRVSTVEHSGGVITDSLGQYRLCGVPTESWLLVQIQHRDRLGAAFQVLVSESSGVTLQHLSFSESGTRPLTALLAAQGDATQLTPLSGTASLAGTIRSSGGRPVVNAEVRVVSTSPITRTDAEGRFQLTGLPTGTQELEIRELGSQVQRQPVELRDGRITRSEVRLRNVVALDPVRTMSTRARYERFEIDRRTSLNGIFLSQEDIERRHVQQMSELLNSMVSFRVIGQGQSARVVNLRGRCSPNIVVEYRENQEINSVPPALVAAMEVYPTANGAPPEFSHLCGVIRLWLKQ